jgi:adenosylcobinamide kinase/adenosylcobinamide-phosphate guanylyltransferase
MQRETPVFSSGLCRPLASITLVLGGARSGKSQFAEKLALERSGPKADGPKIYLATYPRAIDVEMGERIARHRQMRSQDFVTVENRHDLLGVAQEFKGATILLDCLTLWLFVKKSVAGGMDEVLAELKQDLEKSRSLVRWVIVSNEVGLGIVPAGQESREFRDLAGWANQSVAALAEEVVFMVAGIPWVIKGPGARQNQ